MPIVVGVAVLAAGALAVWMLLTSLDGGSPSASPTPSATIPTQGGPSGSPSPRPSKTSHPTRSATATPTASPTATPSRTNQPTATPVPKVGVYVFNQTTVTGAAAAFAATLESQGWTVLGVDNWIGHVPESTVYYWPGDKAAAERLSRDLPQIGRVWPASSPMPGDGLVVILAGDPPK